MRRCPVSLLPLSCTCSYRGSSLSSFRLPWDNLPQRILNGGGWGKILFFWLVCHFFVPLLLHNQRLHKQMHLSLLSCRLWSSTFSIAYGFTLYGPIVDECAQVWVWRCVDLWTEWVEALFLLALLSYSVALQLSGVYCPIADLGCRWYGLLTFLRVLPMTVQ